MTNNRRLEHLSGGIRLEQISTKSVVGIKISARSIVDIEERFPHEIHYQLIEEDLKGFSGYWRLKTISSSQYQTGIKLIHNFTVLPKPIILGPVFNHFLKNDIGILLAVRQRVENLFGKTGLKMLMRCIL